MPNFCSLVGLEVADKFGVGGGGFQVATVSYPNPSCLELHRVELGLSFDNICFTISQKIIPYSWTHACLSFNLLMSFLS